MRAMDEEDKEDDEVQNYIHQSDMQDGVRCINFLCLKFKKKHLYLFVTWLSDCSFARRPRGPSSSANAGPGRTWRVWAGYG